MLTKILTAAAAAAALGGAGLYVAYHHLGGSDCSGGCPLSRMAPTEPTPSVTLTESACSLNKEAPACCETETPAPPASAEAK
jgi:hypothetical protein